MFLERLILVQIVDGGHLAKISAELGMKIMNDCHSPKKRLDDGPEVLLHESLGAHASRVEEEEDAIVRGQLAETIVQQRATPHTEHLSILVRVGWWNVALDH
jgi:hypothetical protein